MSVEKHQPRVSESLDASEVILKAMSATPMASCSVQGSSAFGSSSKALERVSSMSTSLFSFSKENARTVETQGTVIEYFSFGSPAGLPLMLVHGFPDSPTAWLEVLERLDLSNVRVIASYQRGYGRSKVLEETRKSGSFAALGQDLLNLADALGIHRFCLAGHDWGARAAYAAAILQPQRILSLTALASPYVSWGGGLLPPNQVRGYWYQTYFQTHAAEEMLARDLDEFCEALWRSWSPTYDFAITDFEAAAEAWKNPDFTSTVLNYYRLRWKSVEVTPFYAELQHRLESQPLPKIRVPTVFIQGDADQCDLVEGASQQETYFDNYRRLVLSGIGHFPHREAPNQVAQTIQSQLAVAMRERTDR